MVYTFPQIQNWLRVLYKNRPLVITPYAYNLTFTALSQNTTQTGQLSVTANADFVLLWLAHRANIAAAQTVSSVTAPYIRLQITDSGSNEQFFGQAVDLTNVSNGGQESRPLPFPRWIGGRTSLTVQVANYAPTAETYAIDLTFNGVLVRGYSRPNS